MKFHSLNIHAQGLKNAQALIEWHKANLPSWSMIMDGLALAREIKQSSPNTQVIARQYMPDGFWYSQTPEAFLGFTDREQIDANLWVYVENEAGINVEWNVRLLEANAKREHPRKLVILNTSVGTDNVEHWRAAAPLLRLADQYRDFVVIGRHEYFDGHPTSGFLGGYPDNAGVAFDLNAVPGTSGRNFVPHTLWPLKGEVQKDSFTKFHCGRFTFVNQACLQLGIKAPRIVLTEHGQDDLGDMKPWIIKHAGEGIRGYKTLQDYWSKVYPGWTLDQTYFEMLKYLRNNVYAGSNVEGALIFCHSHIDTQWEKFDIEGTDVMRLLTEDTVSPIVPIIEPPAPAPVVVIPPVEVKPVVEPPKPAILPTADPNTIIHVTPGGSAYVEHLEPRDWKVTAEIGNLTRSEAELLLKLFPLLTIHPMQAA
jgi:hypothetical protein